MEKFKLGLVKDLNNRYNKFLTKIIKVKKGLSSKIKYQRSEVKHIKTISLRYRQGKTYSQGNI